ncbi:MAG: DUF421 domain-containing protein [Clostridia bacterium]|nr:DUF421 domain-containing protein [Clostridia bacterium]
MTTVLLRTLFVYLLFILSIRLMGKRQVGELQLSELVTTFMISELAVNPILDLSIPLSYSIIPVLFLLSSEVIMSFIATKSDTAKRIIFGNPSLIIKNGILNQKELGRLRIGVSELLAELRLKDVGDISQVEYAFLEQNGKLSVFLKKNAQESGQSLLQSGMPDSSIAFAVIVDGKINESNLEIAKKDGIWLEKELKRNGATIESVFLMTVDDTGKSYIIMKEEK